jgi:hypothetical protein
VGFDAAFAAANERAAAQRAEQANVLPPPDWSDIPAPIPLQHVIWTTAPRGGSDGSWA